MSPFILLALGLLLIFFEFYLPGGVMGTIGSLTVLASIVIFTIQSDSPIAVFFFIVGSVTAVVLLFKFALWRIRHAEPGRSIYLDNDQEGYVASSYEASTIGKKGIVESDLRPGGYSLVEGKKYLAISQSGYLSKGEEIEVLGGQGESLTVKGLKK